MKKLIFGMCFGLFTTVIYTQHILAADEIGKRHPGMWVKEATFLQLNIGCLQVWQCKSKEDVLHSKDTNLRTTAPVKSIGACNSGGGSADSCNICAASEPNETCEWWLERK